MRDEQVPLDLRLDGRLHTAEHSAASRRHTQGTTYHNVLARERALVRDAPLHMRAAWHLVAQPHRDVAQQRGVEEPVVAVLARVLVVKVLVLVVPLVQLQRSLDVLQAREDVVLLP